MTENALIYLDNAATTRIAPEVREAMEPFLGPAYGNAATFCSAGAEAARAVETARAQVAALLHAADPEEIVFTSGATESDNWALQSAVLGTGKKHIVTSAVEHHAVLETCEALERLGLGVEVTRLPVDGEGRVNPDELRAALRPDTALVSIMTANNEVGTVEPVAALAAIARERGVPFHTDAVQAAGKIPLDVQALGVDLLSLSGHKFHAPKGIGALYIRKGVRLRPLLHGGGQERRRRAGTSNAAGIVGMGAAAELAAAHLSAEAPRLSALVERLWEGLDSAIPQLRRNTPRRETLPGLLNLCVAGCEGEAMLGYLDMFHRICVSSGSACTTGSLEPSHVLLAMGLPAEVAHGSLRISLSRYTTDAEIGLFREALPAVVRRVREMSPTWTEPV